MAHVVHAHVRPLGDTRPPPPLVDLAGTRACGQARLNDLLISVWTHGRGGGSLLLLLHGQQIGNGSCWSGNAAMMRNRVQVLSRANLPKHHMSQLYMEEDTRRVEGLTSGKHSLTVFSPNFVPFNFLIAVSASFLETYSMKLLAYPTGQ